MRIGLIAPPWVPGPPPAYGGTEAVLDNLARGLTELGHEVVLFTVGESTCPVQRQHLFAHPPDQFGQSLPEAAHVVSAYAALQDADVIHDHTVAGSLIGASGSTTLPPLVVTNHNAYDAAARLVTGRAARRMAVVAISADQASRARPVPIAQVIPHGIDLDVYRPGPGPRGDALAFIGRMSPDKGVHRAVAIAHAAGRPIRIVARMRGAEEMEYFRTRVRPLLSAEDEAPEELPLADRLALLHRSAALVNPISWPEPFGLVMVEALATGTPVITTPFGAAPEIVTHGVTGFVCPDLDSAVRAVGRLDGIDPAACRADAEKRFSRERMARDHEQLYRSLTERHRRSGASAAALTWRDVGLTSA